jgi:hypothetical protein
MLGLTAEPDSQRNLFHTADRPHHPTPALPRGCNGPDITPLFYLSVGSEKTTGRPGSMVRLWGYGLEKTVGFLGKSGHGESLWCERLARLLLVGRPVGCAIRVLARRPGLRPASVRYHLIPVRLRNHRRTVEIVHLLFERVSALVRASTPPAGPMTVASART